MSSENKQVSGDITKETNSILAFFLGLPAVIVIITAASKPDNLGPADETHAQL